MSASKKSAQGTLGLDLFETVNQELKADNAFSEISSKGVKTLYMPEQVQAMADAQEGSATAASSGSSSGLAVSPQVQGGQAQVSSDQGVFAQSSNTALSGTAAANSTSTTATAPASSTSADEGYDPFEPLASRMRPRNIDEYIGQSHLLGPDKPLRKAIERHRCQSMILWGPPGVGKTTLALMLAKATGAVLEQLSAVVSGMADIREAVARAKERRRHAVRTILFVDEVHRFNKLQQDAFLPHVEDGTIIFVGATTENPSFQVNSALLSRARVFVLKKLTDTELGQLLEMTLNSERGLKKENLFMEDRVKQALISLADGDARHLLTTLEMLVDDAADLKDGRRQITYAMVGAIAGRRLLSYDKNGDAYYDLISAFHKSVRGSAPDAALYWYARILEAGGDPSYVARRILAIATEDVGLADPNAMQVALNAWDIFNRVGSAEGERAIAEAAVYMALAPKSNHLYAAFNQVRQDVVTLPGYDVPLYIRNAPTKLMSELGYHDGYRYAHDFPGGYAPGECFMPEELHGRRYYYPSDRGFEKYLKAKQEYLHQRDQMANPDELRYKDGHATKMLDTLKFRYPDIFKTDLNAQVDAEPQGLGPQVSPQLMMNSFPYITEQQNGQMRGREQPDNLMANGAPNQGQAWQQSQAQPQGSLDYAEQFGPAGNSQIAQFGAPNQIGQNTANYGSNQGQSQNQGGGRGNAPYNQGQQQFGSSSNQGLFNSFNGANGQNGSNSPNPWQEPAYTQNPNQPQQSFQGYQGNQGGQGNQNNQGYGLGQFYGPNANSNFQPYSGPQFNHAQGASADFNQSQGNFGNNNQNNHGGQGVENNQDSWFGQQQGQGQPYGEPNTQSMQQGNAQGYPMYQGNAGRGSNNMGPYDGGQGNGSWNQHGGNGSAQNQGGYPRSNANPQGSNNPSSSNSPNNLNAPNNPHDQGFFGGFNGNNHNQGNGNGGNQGQGQDGN